MTQSQLRAPLSLLVAAATWGLIWYPYRLLEGVGLSGSLASFLTYLIAMVMVWALCRGRPNPRHDSLGLLLAVALSAGWTNLAYVLAVIHGEIMRVMLLFYLAPLWTVVLSRVVLNERASFWGYWVVGLSLAGAYVMLAGAGGAPMPANGAEWLGLSAGIGFALSNVLSRKLSDVPSATRALWIFGGVVLITLIPLAKEADLIGIALAGKPVTWALIVITSALLVLATLTVQYGLARLPANRASVILLSELVVAAVASWLLAGEHMEAREWLGGLMIVSASLLSGNLEPRHD